MPCAAGTPPPIHRRRANRTPHHRARPGPRAGELRLARATAPSPRGPTPPRCSRAAASVADRLVESHRSRLQQKAGGRPPRCRAAAEPNTQWPGASTVASTHSTDCRAESQAIGTRSRGGGGNELPCPKERPRAGTRVATPTPDQGQSAGKEHAHRARRLPTLPARSRRPLGGTPQHSRHGHELACRRGSTRRDATRAWTPAEGARSPRLTRRPSWGVPTPQGRVERGGASARSKETAKAAARLQAPQRASLGCALCVARLRTVRRLVPQRATLSPARCGA